MTSLPDRIGEALAVPADQVRDVADTRGGDICHAVTARLTNGRSLFVKTRPGAPPGFFGREAAGLDWLRSVRDGAPVPPVLGVGPDLLVLDRIPVAAPSAPAAERFGADLARTHAAGAQAFGPLDGQPGAGWIGSLPLPDGPWPDWPSMWVQGRVEPFLRAAHDRRSITAADAAAVSAACARIDQLAGPAEPPARLHGDLWSGNVVWGRDGRGWLVDAAAAHGGHRESDLAMLALFGSPHLARTVAAYHEVSPLADGWRDRVALHQLHPVLVHAVLFGGGYGAQAGRLARALR